MDEQPFTPPSFRETAFNCPHCRAYANQLWEPLETTRNTPDLEEWSLLEMATCTHCNKFTVWVGLGKDMDLVYPDVSGVPPVNKDLEKEIQRDYNEAASIVDRSPRGAAALLRLAIQKTCDQLGQGGKGLNDAIAALVRDGTIQPEIQRALDVVRVVGNNALHPGELDIKDDRETAMALFQIVNLIADRAITQPKQVETLYESLPEGARKQVDKRDA